MPLLGALLLLLRPNTPRPWQELLQPLNVGRPVAQGYVLEAPRRGFEGDIVFLTRKPGGDSVVEVHVVPKGHWEGIQETRSFGVAYEAPASSAPVGDSQAVTHALAAALRRNDPGGLSIANIGLTRAVPADLPGAIATLESSRGRIAAALMCIGLIGLTKTGGPLPAALVIFALGLALRAARLDLPFERGQDIQRVFTGHLPVREILTGIGLRDRHPPLYFLVLHVAQWFGQTEAIVRWPAVLAGSLLGPSLFAVFPPGALRRSATLVLSALGVAVAPALIRSSREVSEIPLFGLLVVASVASVTTSGSLGRWRFVAIAAVHGLLFWTYYLAPIVVGMELCALLLFGKREMARPVLAGLVLGLPAVGLGLLTFLRDRPARLAAAALPGLAWGENDTLTMATRALTAVAECFGPGTLFVALAGGVFGMALGSGRGKLLSSVATAILGGTLLGLAALAPWARVQPYYALTVAPLVGVSMPAALEALYRWAWLRPVAATFLALNLTLGTAPALARSAAIWEAPLDEFGPRFAKIIAAHLHPRVITVMHYDATHMAWYLARRAGREVDWRSLRHDHEGKIHATAFDAELIPVVNSHSADSSDAVAVGRLEALLLDRGALVVHRPLLPLHQVTGWLARCTLLDQTGVAELRWCEATKGKASERASPDEHSIPFR
ncbi:MAG TPA: hypothetical protein VG937_10380 [Polyangiaceae bacterium]|nr:hypothetical protein [Polyangiaceae bacterium]